MDRNCYKANSYIGYSLYFNLIFGKLNKYDVAPHNFYNIDKKGFLLKSTTRSKQVFSKQLWD